MKGPKSNHQKITFSLKAAEAQSVLLAGCFTEWEKKAVCLKRLKSGLWKTTVSLAPGTYHYRFIVDGLWHDDPACLTRAANPFGTEDCVVTVAADAG